MEFNNKKLERTSKLINYIIAIALFCFLVSLSGRFIDDIDEWKERPSVEEFYNTEFLSEKESEVTKNEAEITLKKEKKSSIENTVKVVNSNYESAKKSFDNWLEARKTIGSPKEDKDVLSRANKLDEYYKTQQDWEKELLNIDQEIELLNKNISELNELIGEEHERAHAERQKAIRKYDLKVFLIRLLIILPILLLGIFFIMRFRKHKFWPLFLGFVLFSFYAFFFGLVPYLPSYGGYVRSIVGVILTIFLGIYAINRIRKFIELKKQELKTSTTERAKKVRTETAEKALNNHMCPSCGKDFIVRKWDKSLSQKGKAETYGIVTNFCRFCGLELFKKCKNCNSENFAHLPYCSTCGDSITEDE